MARRISVKTVIMLMTLLTGNTTARAMDACTEDQAAAGRSLLAPLRLAVGFEANRAWMAAQYRELGIDKQTTREPVTTAIVLRHAADTVRVSYGPEGIVVSRGGRSVVVNSAEAMERLQELLGGSSAVFAARAMLSELEYEDDLRAPEMSLLSSLAFVASLAGDVNAPRRLADRFVARHRGFVRPVRWETCWDTYTKESTAAWNDLQACMDEANQDESIVRSAYRRVACNGTWMARSESAWFEYLGCIQPLRLFKA